MITSVVNLVIMGCRKEYNEFTIVIYKSLKSYGHKNGLFFTLTKVI